MKGWSNYLFFSEQDKTSSVPLLSYFLRAVTSFQKQLSPTTNYLLKWHSGQFSLQVAMCVCLSVGLCVCPLALQLFLKVYFHCPPCPFLSVSVCHSQFLSVSVHFCQFLFLSVSHNFHPILSVSFQILFISVYFCLLLSIFVHFCSFLSVSVYFCPFLSVPGYFCLFLSIFVCFCLFLAIFVCQSLTVSISFCLFLSGWRFFWNQYYYLQTPKDSLSPICRISTETAPLGRFSL